MSVDRRPPPIPARILCVDDNRAYADSLALLFNMVGFEARACYCGAAALDLNEAFRPSICFIDLNMPGMDGDELVTRIYSEPGWRPFLLVAVTAMSNEASRARNAAAGFQMYLVKPVDPEKLLEVAGSLFRHSSNS
jgi:two-component system OmpR family response regulator